MKGKAHSDEVRAQVIAALLAGQGVNEVARKYSLDSGLVSKWKKTIPKARLTQVDVEKKEKLADLIEAHMNESLKAAAAIARKTSDDKWLSKQNAADVGVFYGILTDKAVRILEAAESAHQPEGDGAPEGRTGGM